MFTKIHQGAVEYSAVSGTNSLRTAPIVFQKPRSQPATLFAFIILAVLTASASAQAGTSAPLDLNRATAAQLVMLPGIGEVKAAAILAVRDSRGGFQSLDELEAVRGIGPSLASKLRPLVTISVKGRRGAKR
jgi:competence ComEA-like helix-hairpin-helix protein